MTVGLISTSKHELTLPLIPEILGEPELQQQTAATHRVYEASENLWMEKASVRLAEEASFIPKLSDREDSLLFAGR